MKEISKELNNPVYQNVLKLLEFALGNEEKCDLSNFARWNETKEELNRHAILPLVSDALMNSELSDSERLDLMKNTAINVRTFHKLMTAQKNAFDLFESNNIHAVVLKGAAAAQYYVRPELRQYGDMDILVPPEDYRKAFDLLCSSGYVNVQDYDAEYKRHIGFTTPEGKKLELHRFFSSSSNTDQNDILDQYLYDEIRNAEKINLCGYSAPVLPKLENGLVLLGHINQHLSVGLGLRQIIDWMMYVRAGLTDEFWNNEFQDRAKAIGMDCLAETVTKMCQKYLGLSSEYTWCSCADEELADELMLYILNKGNFGTKENIESRAVMYVAHNFINPIKLFKYLTYAGSIHMEEAGLKPIKAVAWIYQIVRLVSQTLRSKRNGSLTKDIKEGVYEADFMERLGVTRI